MNLSSIQNQIPLLALYNAYKVQKAQRAGLVPVTENTVSGFLTTAGAVGGSLVGMGVVVVGGLVMGVHAGRKMVPSNKELGTIMGLIVGFPLVTARYGMKKMKSQGAGATFGLIGGSIAQAIALGVAATAGGVAGAVPGLIVE